MQVEREKEAAKDGGDNPYPSWEALRREDREEAPSVSLIVRDAAGNVVRRITAATGKGYHRVAWDLRHAAPDPVNLNPPSDLPPITLSLTVAKGRLRESKSVRRSPSDSPAEAEPSRLSMIRIPFMGGM